MNKYIALFASAALLLSGCSFLDKMPDDMKTDEMVWTNRNEVLSYLSNIYAVLPEKNCVESDWNGLWFGLSDELDLPWSPFNALTEGSWDPTTPTNNVWASYYKAIRASFELEANIGRCAELADDLKTRYTGEAIFLRGYYYFLLVRQYGPVVLIKERASDSADYSNMQRNSFDECIDYIVECMDKAYDLLPYSYLSDKNNLGRATKVACYAVKTQALLLAASEQWNGNEEYYSLLRNKDGKPLVESSYDQNKWKRAADAAKSVIDLAEVHHSETGLGLYYGEKNDVNSADYNPYKAYYNIEMTGWNEEIIFGTVSIARSAWNDYPPRYGYMYHCLPSNGKYKFNNGAAPTLRLVDAFYMENGRSIDDPASGYVEEGFTTSNGKHYNPVTDGEPKFNEATEDGRKGLIDDLKKLDSWGHSKGDWNMFANREARFYASINYNHRVQLFFPSDKDWMNSLNNRADQQDGWGRLELYYGGMSNNSTLTYYPHSGFLVQKRIVPGDFSNQQFSNHFVTVYIRYGEILLDYIEALNEYDPSNPDIKKYWDLIRQRAGLPSIFDTYPAIAGDKDAQRKYILRERQVELNLEGDRFFTCHRRLLCMDASANTVTSTEVGKFGDQGPVWGLSMRAGDPETNSFKSTDFYKRTIFETRVFKKQFYLFPIPQEEINKSPGLTQNPWW